MINLIINLFILFSTFIAVYYLKTSSIIPGGYYAVLLPIYIVIFLSFSAYFNSKQTNFKKQIKSNLYIFIFTLFTMSFIISVTDLYEVSRMFILYVIAISVILHWMTGFLWEKSKDDTKGSLEINGAVFRVKRLIISFLILILSFVLMNYFKAERVVLYPWTEEMLPILIGFWGLAGVITRKFYAYNSINIYYKMAPILKSNIFIILFAAFAYFFFRLEWVSRDLLFGTILINAVLEASAFSLVFLFRRTKSIYVSESKGYDQQKPLSIETNSKGISLNEKLSALPWFQDKKLIEFISQGFRDHQCENDTTVIMETTNPLNFHPFSDGSQTLFINLSLMNDLMSISAMLRTLRNKLQPGGIYIGSYSPLEAAYDQLKEKMPDFMFFIHYPLHFLLFRIIPRLPGINVLYFHITKGKGRFLSTAEIYGRLSYWGFRVEKTIQVDHKIYFIAKLVNTTSTEQNPSYGPFVKLKRIGLNGDLISIYKFRTMHPYSEFIQKEVFEKNHLNESGKLNNDFRVTRWGKALRKLWIDELPQLINWVRGDVNLVGVRALSEHYFSLYPKELQDLRTQFKPGLVPPYYADMPKTFDEILNSERNYLNRKKTNPFTTDVIYFWKAFKNIVFKGARSG